MASTLVSPPTSPLSSPSQLPAVGDATSGSKSFQSRFTVARIRNCICLVESAQTSTFMRIYCHELAGVFRFSHIVTSPPDDLVMLEKLDPESIVLDDETAVVFVARDVMARVSRMTMPIPLQRRSSMKSTTAPPRSRRVVRGWNAGL